MSFDRACELCRRSTRQDGTPVEVCWSAIHRKFTCLYCHFERKPS